MGTGGDSAYSNEDVLTHGVVDYILMGIGVNSSYGNEDVLTHGVVDSAWASLTTS